MKLLSLIFAIIAAIATYGVFIGETHQLLILGISGTMAFLLWNEASAEEQENLNNEEDGE